MRRSSVGLVLAIAAIAAGCGHKGTVPVTAYATDGGDAVGQPDLAADSIAEGRAPDVGADREAGPVAAAATFVLTNTTDRSIYIQTSGLSGQEYWSVTQGGKRLPVNNTCAVCDCSECPSCSVCGRSLARVQEVKAGDHFQWTWDGRIWPSIANACRPNLNCEQEEVVAAGAALQIDVTYSFSFATDPSFGADDQFIGTVVVSSTAFTHPPAASVQVTASP